MDNRITRITTPPFLEPGDTIGVATPGSLFTPEPLAAGLSLLEDWGFKTRVGRTGIRKRRFLAGTDQERADELLDLFRDPEVKAIICSRGGYGAQRILDRLDYRVIAQHPKMFVGFSDVTVLLAAFWKMSRLMTFHGPMVTTLRGTRKTDREGLRTMLLGGLPEGFPLTGKGKIRGGQATGVLLGGNLTLLAHLIGTPFEPAWDRLILFVEDQGESGYRLDRLWTHLRLAGVFRQIRGLLIGQLSGGGIGKPDWDLFLELFADLDIPIWRGLPVGHGRENLTLPVGAPVELDGEKGRLTFLW